MSEGSATIPIRAPEHVVEEIERQADEANVSKSRLGANILTEYVEGEMFDIIHADEMQEIRDRLDELDALKREVGRLKREQQAQNVTVRTESSNSHESLPSTQRDDDDAGRGRSSVLR
jgi:hypothetical protein